MKKTAVIILADGFEEIEAVTPIDILRRSGIEVVVAGLSGRQVKSSRSLLIEADCGLSGIPENFDALILPGGQPGADHLAASEQVTELIKKQYKRHGIIAAICASPAVVLYPAGVLKGKKMTCYPGFEKNFLNDVNYTAERVVIDGNIMTSAGPGTAFEFSLALAERLAGRDIAYKVGKATLYMRE